MLFHVLRCSMRRITGQEGRILSPSRPMKTLFLRPPPERAPCAQCRSTVTLAPKASSQARPSHSGRAGSPTYHPVPPKPARPFDIATRNPSSTHCHILKRVLLPFSPSWFCHALHISASLTKQQEAILAILMPTHRPRSDEAPFSNDGVACWSAGLLPASNLSLRWLRRCTLAGWRSPLRAKR